jgi:hypothetical protein
MILALTLESFRQRLPMLQAMSTDFSDATLKLDQTVIAHVPTLPTSSTYDNTTGYLNGAQTGRSLLVDVPVVVDQHKHVTLQWKHINNIKDQKVEFQKMISNAAYVLAKAIVDSVLAKFVAANVSRSISSLWEDVDRETLKATRKLMNLAGAASEGRVIIGNTDFCGQLGDDQRIASRDYSGQQVEADAYAHYRNVEGFADIWEYPDMPANSEDIMAVAFEPRAVAIAAGIPDESFTLAEQLGVPSCGATEIMSDPDTGFTLLAINWMTPGTFDLNLTLTAVWGSAVGKQAGSANTICDKAAVLLIDEEESSGA